jgi:hypothetical protein
MGMLCITLNMNLPTCHNIKIPDYLGRYWNNEIPPGKTISVTPAFRWGSRDMQIKSSAARFGNLPTRNNKKELNTERN